MKKQYLLPSISLLIFVEEDILTTSAVTTAVENAKAGLNKEAADASIKMSSIVVLE